jgi:hypothetical protein
MLDVRVVALHLCGNQAQSSIPFIRAFCIHGRYTRQGALAYAAEISGTQ